MTDNVNESREKFKKVLSIITPQKIVSDDTFLEKIQSYLTFTEYNDFIKDPETIAWIDRTVNSFDSNELPTQQVANFTLKLLCLICSNEWQFAEIKDKNVLDKIQRGIEEHQQLQKPSIMLSHIQLLHSVSKHSIGLQWLKQSRSWKLVIAYYERCNTMFIIRDSGNFLFDILTKFTELMKDENLCLEIIEAIMTPLINFRGKDSAEAKTELVVDDEALSRCLMPCINIVNHILIMCIESNKRSRMAYFILIKYRYENKIWLAMDLVENNSDFITILTRGLNISNFARLSNMNIPPSDTTATDLTFQVHGIHFYNLILACMHRRIFKNVNMIAEMHHHLWHKLGDRFPLDIYASKFGDQVMLIQFFPLIYIIKSQYKHKNSEFFVELTSEMFKMSCEHTVRLIYQYRDALHGESFDYVADLAANSIQRTLSLKKVLSRERATLAFRVLIYVLNGYVDESSLDEKKTSNTELVLQAPSLLSTLLIGINDMIKNYNFTWKESIESTTIVSLLLVLLDNSNLSARQTVESLKLIQTSIEHFLAPNLALLMDKMEGSGMEELGPTIYKRLHDNSWEVRDSVLELLHSIVEISNEKFPAFQSHVLESKICETVEIIARNDSEPYVRASAFKVLASMIKIRSFWDQALHEMDFKKYAVEVLGAEGEGVVRREAVACIGAIYNHQEIPSHYLDLIFSVMAHCAVNDFYWEVKVNALNFWRTVISRQAGHQGMIGKSFPAVTFSKEHKKIITLNDKEIQIRLLKVLNELSLRGCLGVLVGCLQDSDLEVIKKVISVVNALMDLLNKYNFIEEYNKSKKKSSGNSSPTKPVLDINFSQIFDHNLAATKDPVVRNNADGAKSRTTEVAINRSYENGEICPDEMVIDSIVQSDDLTLLTDNYKKNLNIKCENMSLGLIDENLFKKFATVGPEEFLNCIANTDLEALVQNKTEWLLYSENFSTLLDDVLRSFGHEMDLDCY